MPPSAIIDSDLNPFDNTVYYALEQTSIWKATTLGGGNAVWTEVYTAATFEAASGCTLTVFTRIRCANQDGLIYVIGYAQTSEQSGDDYTIYCFRSSNHGVTWNYEEITECSIPDVDYYFSSVTEVTETGSVGTTTILNEYTFRCQGNHFGNGVYGWHTYGAYVYFGGTYGSGSPDSMKVVVTGTQNPQGFPNKNWHQWAPAKFCVPSDEGGGEYLFSSMNTGVVSDQLIHITIQDYGTPRTDTWDYICRITEIDGQPVYSGIPYAFDVAPSNANWLYVGCCAKIWASEDGGSHWFEFYTGHGANDICVDPQLAGAIYYWSTDGSLNLLVKQALQAEGILTSTGLMTESALNIPLRIGRDPSSGRLLAIPNGATLKMRNLGAETDLKTGLGNGRGLHVYGQKIIFIECTDIYISDDLYAGTPTITAKKGGWAAYSSGVNAHRILST